MQPLAERMRPQSLSDIIGQDHLIGPGKILSLSIENKHLPSLIFWGPPGVGKTSLAQILAKELQRSFTMLSAVQAGVKDVRETIEKAKSNRFFDTAAPILFIDEIHRFNKSQQDALLSAVEQGIITLMGATTENPSFEVNAALLSRCQVYVLNAISIENLLSLTQKIIKTDYLFQEKTVVIKEHHQLIALANGDARKLCNILEIVGNLPDTKIEITDSLVSALVQKNIAVYDKAGEMHYDIASAFIKSIRGSDPNATLYWLARMIEGGEDVRFIARRLCISAAEDIGLANPNALLMANACKEAVDFIGWPESRIVLSECAIYLACSPKSNSAYIAIEKALELARRHGTLPVPLHLRNAATPLMKELSYGKDYQYAHQFKGNFIEQEYLPSAISGTPLYEPSDNANEQKMKEYLSARWGPMYGSKT